VVHDRVIEASLEEARIRDSPSKNLPQAYTMIEDVDQLSDSHKDIECKRLNNKTLLILGNQQCHSFIIANLVDL